MCNICICTVSLAWCKSHIMDISSITDRKLDLMFKQEQPFGRQVAVFLGLYLSLHRSCALSPELLRAEKHFPVRAGGMRVTCQCRSPSPAPLSRTAWDHRASSAKALPACNAIAMPLFKSFFAGFKAFNLKILICPSLSQILDFCLSCGDFQNFVRKAVLRNSRLMSVLEVLVLTLTY